MINICISIYIEHTGTGYIIKLSSNSYDGVATFLFLLIILCHTMTPVEAGFSLYLYQST